MSKRVTGVFASHVTVVRLLAPILVPQAVREPCLQMLPKEKRPLTNIFDTILFTKSWRHHSRATHYTVI